jgi:hypothetical protein
MRKFEIEIGREIRRMGARDVGRSRPETVVTGRPAGDSDAHPVD